MVVYGATEVEARGVAHGRGEVRLGVGRNEPLSLVDLLINITTLWCISSPCNRSGESINTYRSIQREQLVPHTFDIIVRPIRQYNTQHYLVSNHEVILVLNFEFDKCRCMNVARPKNKVNEE